MILNDSWEYWKKDLNSGTFDNYFILQKHNKNTRNNSYSIRLPLVKLGLVRQSFYFYGGKLYKKLSIGIRELDTFSEVEYSYLAIVHMYMYFISIAIFSELPSQQKHVAKMS